MNYCHKPSQNISLRLSCRSCTEHNVLHITREKLRFFQKYLSPRQDPSVQFTLHKTNAILFVPCHFYRNFFFNNSILMCDVVKSGINSPMFQAHMLRQQRHISLDQLLFTSRPWKIGFHFFLTPCCIGNLSCWCVQPGSIEGAVAGVQDSPIWRGGEQTSSWDGIVLALFLK
jgi:hypothetical protein